MSCWEQWSRAQSPNLPCLMTTKLVNAVFDELNPILSMKTEPDMAGYTDGTRLSPIDSEHVVESWSLLMSGLNHFRSIPCRENLVLGVLGWMTCVENGFKVAQSISKDLTAWEFKYILRFQVNVIIQAVIKWPWLRGSCRLSERFRPERIILFGSYAQRKGRWQKRSWPSRYLSFAKKAVRSLRLKWTGRWRAWRCPGISSYFHPENLKKRRRYRGQSPGMPGKRASFYMTQVRLSGNGLITPEEDIRLPNMVSNLQPLLRINDSISCPAMCREVSEGILVFKKIEIPYTHNISLLLSFAHLQRLMKRLMKQSHWHFMQWQPDIRGKERVSKKAAEEAVRSCWPSKKDREEAAATGMEWFCRYQVYWWAA